MRTRGTPIPCRRVVTLPPHARHARHSQARFMSPSLGPRPLLRLLYLRLPPSLLEPHRNSPSIHLSRIRCPWWNIPLHPPVRQAGLTLGQQTRRVTVVNYYLGVMQRVGLVRAMSVGHKQQIFSEGNGVRSLSSWSHITVAIIYSPSFLARLLSVLHLRFRASPRPSISLLTSLIYGVYNL
jgi:hypothetical protein